MAIFRIPDELIFPHPHLAEKNGLLGIGGDLSEERLLLAYSMGIFPWYSEGEPILWWSPDPRLVLFPLELKISRSLRQTLKKNIYTITMDRAFEDVIRECAIVHTKKDGNTWITEEMIEAYTRLHRSGYAHSVEVWSGKELSGGLYGVSLGRAFFGESMFTKKTDASKVALVYLVRYLQDKGFDFIDCQVPTVHLKRMGAREVPRTEFLKMLKEALNAPTLKGMWRDEIHQPSS